MKKNTSQEKRKPQSALFLSRRDAEASHYDALVVPSSTNWDDFGHSLAADIGLRAADGRVQWFDGRFAVLDVTKLSAFASEAINKRKEGYPLYDFGRPFASLLTDAREYSLARRTIGVERAWEQLRSLHDVSVLTYHGISVPDWQEFFTTKAFRYGMTRESEAYFAYRKGAKILAGMPLSGTDALSPFRATLKGAGPKLTLEFNFSSTNSLRGRIAVLVGKNGTGKTSTLVKLTKALADRESKVSHLDPQPEVNQVLAFAHSASLAQFRRGLSALAGPAVRTFSLVPAASRQSAREESDTQLLLDIARAHDDEGEPLLAFLKSILQNEFPDIEIQVPLRPTNAEDTGPLPERYVPFSAWPKGSEQRRLDALASIDTTLPLRFTDTEGRPRAASLGQLAFLRFALVALANAGPASVFLMDEPENFLHPNLISRFMRVLHIILKQTRSIAIIATHSPFIVREVQREQVHVIHSDEDGEMVVGHPRLQTLGANVTSVSNEVFGDDTHEHLYQELLAEAERQAIDFGEALRLYGTELSLEAMMQLRSKIEARDAEA